MEGRLPRPDPEGHVRVGQIVGPFGTKGGMKVLPLTDFPERFAVGAPLFLNGSPVKVTECHWHKGQARILVVGVTTIEAVEALKWQFLTVPEEVRPSLDEDEYMASDLVGLEVFERGSQIGVVEAVIHAPAQDLLQIGDALIPCVHEFIKNIDIENRRIDVELIEGLRPGEQAEEVR